MSTPPIDLRELTGERSEMEALQHVIERAPDYMYRVTGHPPGRAEAQSTYVVLPEGKSYDDKFVYGIYLADHMVGCADVIRAYPTEETIMLGLLLLAESYQHQGIGAAAYRLLEDKFRAWPRMTRVRIGVVRTNEQVLPFWRKLGFVETGEVKLYQYDKLVSETIILEKEL